MRLFAASSPQEPSPRTVVPADILRRLAFGRPQRGSIQPASPTVPAAADALPEARADSVDLDQRVRQSGEW